MPARIDFDKRETKRIVKLYTNLTPMADIALEYQVSIPTIRRVLVGAGVEIRPRGRVAQS